MRELQFRITGLTRDDLRRQKDWKRPSGSGSASRTWFGASASGSFLFLTAVAVATVYVVQSAPVPLSQHAIVWGNNNSSYGNHMLEAFDLDTGAVVQQFLAPNPDAVNGNGRGILVLGTTIYYSIVGSGKIYVTDSETHADLGVLFDTGLPGIADLAWDGAHFWVSAYAANRNFAYEYDTSGKLLKTKELAKSKGQFDGLEIANGHIIANEFDAGDGGGNKYDVYDMEGKLLKEGLITTAFRATGIAFDGSHYVVSEFDGNELAVYDLKGVLLKEVPLSGSHLLEDLSFQMK